MTPEIRKEIDELVAQREALLAALQDAHQLLILGAHYSRKLDAFEDAQRFSDAAVKADKAMQRSAARSAS